MKPFTDEDVVEETIYLKSEPSGEIFFGKLDERKVEILKSLYKTAEFNESELVESPTNSKTIAHCTGISSDDWEYYNIDVIEEINVPQEDGFYILAAYLSKYSLEFSFIPADSKPFNVDKLSVDVVLFKLGDVVQDENYGRINFGIIEKYRYTGIEIEESREAELIDNDIDLEITIFQVKDKKTSVIYKYRPYDNEEATWGEFLD